MATPQNYTLGRGELWFSRFKPGTQIPEGFRYFGNTPELSTTSESENLDHYSSDRGIREKDASIMLQLDRTGSFTTDSIQAENLALFFLGDANALTVTAQTAVTDSFDEVTPGYAYQLGMTAASPAGARLVDNVVVKDDSGTPVTFDAGVDYVVDLERGTVTVLEGGAIEKGDNLRVTFDIKASTREVVVSGSKPVEGALKYVSYNPEGKQFDHFWPYVKITPNGDFALKSDEWQTIPFNFEVLKKTGLEAVYINGAATAN
ncbi:putative major tail protein [Achromobacter phage vB_AchrS_AchV4]|uniref:Putative major tail protein n=1 Tax=Achromobacter phage vB_AchrS_AchV4 TaxID=2796514 RepID=A0A7T3U6N0_9CAUD|nr:major tail protein with Ig-like domain [Achromobacter phage vB_AchrS_AchV4]QPZ53259.1 putative major tail protein [Achromobacter phage vB_AchrS_AchV4]